MVPAYGKLRAARFMGARGVPACLLVLLLRLGERRRQPGAARAWSTLPWTAPRERTRAQEHPASQPRGLTAASAG
ncbi:hypothetical protein [Pseudoduganella chitinolytica]|uniref:Uncharacterized protein n=1 Tax=Pseudoduganella chitinolytica TaxID=34070 RepID=A0ABY8BG93_9BURK|nr:hypothetical protein [Pseudoduganella chitinolytica]WEF34925.1 hypothetical protein PX653_09235 [Pseudoduganella chitinolytica]